MVLHPAVRERLDRLAPDQRAAATASPGPVLCVAPAGSGKTTTLVARIAWLVASGAPPATVCAVTFNRRAAEELRARLDAALEPLGIAPGGVRVRTFHALGREIVLGAGEPVEPLVDRKDVLRALMGPACGDGELRRLDDEVSRLKLDLGLDAARAPGAAAAGACSLADAEVFARYETALHELAALDHDDLVARALRLLETRAPLLDAWRRRCEHLLVDEVQDVDRSQLRLALLLAAPTNRVFLVGDDDQTIYAWRLADVRRVLGLASALPGLRRVDLVTNYRCPPAVVERAVRLVEVNRERFAKRILARPGATGSLVLAPDAADDVARARLLLRGWGVDGGTHAVLARTNAELAPYAAVCVESGIPYRAADDGLVLDGFPEAAGGPGSGLRLLPDLAAGAAADGAARALLPWAPVATDLSDLMRRVSEARDRRASLRRDDATLTLATIHGTKGLEFDHVAAVNLDAGRFPNERSLVEAADPVRELEEERRLAYVAWTRARRSLTLVYDPGSPSRFMEESFSPGELTGP
jgi:superfamily I DNA/RNA helicase